MSTREIYLDRIEHELGTARAALRSGNDGKARVCARRAVGQALTWFLSHHPLAGWGADAIGQLRHLRDEPTFPQDVRGAAARLTAKVSERGTDQFTKDPIGDGELIICHIRKVMESEPR